MEYLKYTNKDFDAWLKMALDLWPDYENDELAKILKSLVKSEKEKTFIAKNGHDYAGFINVSLRYEYVEGAESSPVGYVEGIYVKPEYRKTGVASELLKVGEQWVFGKGCSEMGSDTWLRNHDGQKFHKRLGFEVADTIVHFVKKIDPPV